MLTSISLSGIFFLLRILLDFDSRMPRRNWAFRLSGSFPFCPLSCWWWCCPFSWRSLDFFSKSCWSTSKQGSHTLSTLFFLYSRGARLDEQGSHTTWNNISWFSWYALSLSVKRPNALGYKMRAHTYLPTGTTVVPPEGEGECSSAVLAHGHPVVRDPHWGLQWKRIRSGEAVFSVVLWCLDSEWQESQTCIYAVDQFLSFSLF